MLSCLYKEDVHMFTKDDIKYLNFFKESHPDIYQNITALYSRTQTDIRNGCHDLRNIVALISGNFQLIELENPELSQSARWRQMGGDIDNMVSALDAISEYRKADSLKLRRIDTSEYIWQIQETLVSDNICTDISMSVPPTIPPIRIDTVKISYVIKALASNITDVQPDAPVMLSIEYDADNLYIHIADELDGIDEKIKSSLFVPFNTNKQDRIGMSLATSYRILLAHNGELSYRPNTPKGSVFTLTLPLDN